MPRAGYPCRGQCWIRHATEKFQGSRLRGGGEGVVAQISRPPAGFQREGYHVLGAHFLLILDLLRHQDFPELAGDGAGLRAMGLVGDDREVPFLEGRVLLDLLQHEGKRLNRHDDDGLSLDQRLRKLLGFCPLPFLAVDTSHHAFPMLELIDRVLELVVEQRAVGDDEDRVENLVPRLVVERGELMRRPRDGIRFPRSGGMLPEILMARPLIK